MKSTPQELIHQAYLKLVHPINLPFSGTLHFMWDVFLGMGYTEADLTTVVQYRQRGIKSKLRHPPCLLPRNLIRDLEAFAEDLAISRAESRKVLYSPARAATLRASGRPDVPQSKDAIAAGQRALGLLATFKRGNV